MARAPRTFTTLPARAIADTSLTALDLRCLAVIALHDGMSGPKGAGGGCFAKNATLAALVRTDVTNFSKSLARLIRLGYVAREPQVMDKRRFTLRVQYPADDSWRNDQQSDAEEVGQPTNDQREIVGEEANHPAEIVGDGERENGGFSKGIGRDYIPLNGELHSVETDKLNSPKGRIVADARRPAGIICQLPDGFNSLPMGARVAKIEAAFGALDRDPDAIPESEREKLNDWLYGVWDDFPDDPFGQQAMRLLQEIEQYGSR